MTMKKIFPWLIASAAILLALPWLAVTFVESDAGMAVSLFLFFVLNPIYAICTGAYAGKDIKKFWVLPVITALFFLAGAWWFFEPVSYTHLDVYKRQSYASFNRSYGSYR